MRGSTRPIPLRFSVATSIQNCSPLVPHFDVRRPEVHTFYLQITYDFMTDSSSSRVNLQYENSTIRDWLNGD